VILEVGASIKLFLDLTFFINFFLHRKQLVLEAESSISAVQSLQMESMMAHQISSNCFTGLAINKLNH